MLKLSMKDDFVYLKHILESIEKIGRFVEGLDFEEFGDDDLVLSATVRELEVIGEASNKLSADFREQHKEIPWDKIINMRNRLIHEYFGVDEKIVWDTCKEDIPDLKRALEELVPKN